MVGSNTVVKEINNENTLIYPENCVVLGEIRVYQLNGGH